MTGPTDPEPFVTPNEVEELKVRLASLQFNHPTPAHIAKAQAYHAMVKMRDFGFNPLDISRYFNGGSDD